VVTSGWGEQDTGHTGRNQTIPLETVPKTPKPNVGATPDWIWIRTRLACRVLRRPGVQAQALDFLRVQAVQQHPQRLVAVLLRPPLRDADMLCERDEKAWPVGSGADPDRGCQVLKVCWPWQACRHV